ncbi:MAG: hypothetical protein AB7F86_04560 [Bdellovibrionales bacterium]
MTFFLPIFVGVGFLEFKLSKIENGYSRKRQLIEDLAGQVEVLVLGNSQAYYDFLPEDFGRSGLNLALPSQSLQIDQQLVDQFAERLKSLRLVVMSLSYFSFEYRLYGEVDDARLFFYPRHLSIAGDGGWLSHLDLRNWSLIATYGVNTTREIVRSGFSYKQADAVGPRGGFLSSQSMSKGKPINDKVGRARAEYHTSTLKKQYAPDCRAAILQVWRWAQARGIQLVLTQTPAHSVYRNHLDPDAVARFRQNVEMIKAQTQVPFFDFLKDERFVEEDYFDPDHLNESGAHKFSQIFADEVVRPSLGHGRN